MLATIAHDLRFTLRQWRRRPTATLVALTILAIGIGANTALFSVAGGVLLRPLPYDDPDRLTRLWPETSLSPQMLEAFQHGLRGVDGVTGFSSSSASLIDSTGEPTTLDVGVVAASHFEVLGIDPRLGRGFRSTDGDPAEPRVVILGAGLWRTRYGADPDILGRTIVLDDASYAVVGVLGDDHRPLRAGWQAWIPLLVDREDRSSYVGSRHLDMVARLADGASLGLAQDELRRVAQTLRDEDPQHISEDSVVTASATRLHDDLVSGARPRLVLLGAAVLGVLLAACANLANLQLTQVAGRHRELAVRTALGAGKRRVVRQLLTESVVLSLTGGLLGVLLAAASIDALVALLAADLPATAEIRLDATMLGFALALSTLVAIVFGLVPAVRAGRDGEMALRTRGVTRTGHRLTSGLVAVQVAASVVLLLGAGLLGRSLWNLTQIDPGFRADGVLTSRVSPSSARHVEAASRRAFYDRLLERAASWPGVASVGMVQSLPLDEDTVWIFPFRSPTGAADDELPITRVSMVDDAFFETLEIPLIAGRGFDRETPDLRSAAVINRAFVRRHFRTDAVDEVVGRSFQLFGTDGPMLEILGVVEDVRQASLGVAGDPELYVPNAQWPQRDMDLLVRLDDAITPAAATRITAELRAATQDIDDRAVLSMVRPLVDSLHESTASERSLVWLVGAFAFQALLLGAAGIYGVTSAMVAERRSEIGIRLALGARRRDVERQVVGRGLALAAIGALLGVLTASAFGRLLAGLLHGVEVADPAVVAATVAVVVGVAVVATWRPARRAGSVDPASVLRSD
ncbi:MAG: ADOP family duplicated permease [Acidobacteriota bacterium]